MTTLYLTSHHNHHNCIVIVIKTSRVPFSSQVSTFYISFDIIVDHSTSPQTFNIIAIINHSDWLFLLSSFIIVVVIGCIVDNCHQNIIVMSLNKSSSLSTCVLRFCSEHFKKRTSMWSIWCLLCQIICTDIATNINHPCTMIIWKIPKKSFHICIFSLLPYCCSCVSRAYREYPSTP